MADGTNVGDRNDGNNIKLVPFLCPNEFTKLYDLTKILVVSLIEKALTGNCG